MHGSKSEIKKSSAQISVPERKFQYERQVFQENSYPEVTKIHFLAPKFGGGGGLIHR